MKAKRKNYCIRFSRFYVDVRGAMSVSAASEEAVPNTSESSQHSPQTEEGLEILTKDMETGEEYVEVIPPTNDGRTSNMFPSTIPEEYEEYLLPPAPSSRMRLWEVMMNS